MNIFKPPKGIAALAPILRDAEERHPSLGIDGSMLEEIMRCPRASYFKHVLKRIAAKPKPELTFGSAMHVALELMNKGASLQQQEAALAGYYDIHPMPEDDYRHLARAKEVLAAYHKAHEDEEPRVIIEAERPFSLVLGEVTDVLERPITIVWEGRTDRRDQDEFGQWVWDYKTAKDFGQYYWAQYLGPSSSVRGYCWSVRRQTGVLPAGFIIDVLIVRKPVERVTARTTPRNQFERRAFKCGLNDIRAWEINTMHIVQSWLRCAAEGYWPQYDRKGYNCQRCQFNDICQQPDEMSAQTLLMETADYGPYEWSPLNERE